MENRNQFYEADCFALSEDDKKVTIRLNTTYVLKYLLLGQKLTKDGFGSVKKAFERVKVNGQPFKFDLEGKSQQIFKLKEKQAKEIVIEFSGKRDKMCIYQTVVFGKALHKKDREL